MTDRAVSRRTFLTRSGALAGGAVLVGSGAVGAGRILAGDRQPKWREPAVRASQNGRLETQLRISKSDVPIAGRPARALTYEESYPGPTLDVRPGDELAIDLINDGPEPTNLHTHGLHVSPQAPSDDVLLHVKHGETYRYRYQLPDDHPGGTLWYHAHLHGLTDDQVFGGLFGLLIVRGALDELPGVAGLKERVLIISQMEVVRGKVVDASSSSLSDQVTLVNGRYQPTLSMETGETQRWRLLNTSSVFLRLSLKSLGVDVIAFDGNALPAPMEKDVLEIPPGGRADVLVRAPDAGTFRLRSMSWKSLGVFYTSMVPNPQVLAKVVVGGPAHVEPDPPPSELLPFDDLTGATVNRRRVFRLEEREPRGVGPLKAFEYYINGEQFDMSRVDVQVPLDATEEWEFRNLTYEPHPLHIHVNPFQVVAINGDRGRAENHYRDSALIPPFGSLTIRHRFLDFTGYLVMHCHILFHEDHGMMQLIEIYGPEGPGPTRLPEHAMHGRTDGAAAWTCRTDIGRSS